MLGRRVVPTESATRGAPGKRVAWGGVAMGAVGVFAGTPLLLLLGVVAALAGAARQWVRYDVGAVCAVAGLLTAAILSGLLATTLQVDLLASPAAVQVSLLSLAVCAAAGAGRGLRHRAPAPTTKAERWSWAPAWAAALLGLLQVSRDGLAASWSLGSSDPAQHVLFLGEIQRSGMLDYGAEAYPRAVHMLLALVASPAARPAGSAEQLVGDLQLYAAATWLSMALVLCAAAGVTHRLGALLDMSRHSAAVAALVVCLPLLLSNATVATYVYMGAAPALLSLAVLWLSVMLGLGHEGVRAPVAVAAAALSLLLLAHLWQALVLVPLAAGVALALRGPVSRLGGLRPLGGPRAWWTVIAACAVLVPAAAVPVLGIQSRGGVSLAGIPGELTPVPWVLLGFALLCAVPLLGHWRDAGVRLLLGTAAGLLAVIAVLVIGAGEGLDFTQYYPSKAAWYLAVLLAPLAALTVVRMAPSAVRGFATTTGRAGRATRVVRFAAVTVPAVLVLAWFGPTWFAPPLMTSSVLQPPSSAPVARTLSVALDAAERPDDVVVVPVGIVGHKAFTRSGAYIVSKLLSFQTRQPVTFGLPDRVCADVEKAAGGRPAIVVTDLDADLLGRLAVLQGCDVPVEQLDGAPPASVQYQNDILAGMVAAGG